MREKQPFVVRIFAKSESGYYPIKQRQTSFDQVRDVIGTKKSEPAQMQGADGFLRKVSPQKAALVKIGAPPVRISPPPVGLGLNA